MGFHVEFRDKDGNVIDYRRLDKEVCELWGVEPDESRWASHPGINVDPDWHEFLGRAVMFTRAIRETGTFTPSFLLMGLSLYGCLDPTLESVDEHKYEMMLLIDWIHKGYQIVVTNTW